MARETTAEPGTAEPGTAGRTRLISGPGILLLWVYGVMVVGALSRSVYQLSTEFDRAPLAYVLSAVAGVVYCFITWSLVRGGEGARTAARICCAIELLGVLVVGTWTLVDSDSFPDSTVWSDYGMGYLFIPVILPVSALLWLRRSRVEALDAKTAAGTAA
ncbi:hypothetical protein RM574_09015 [Streptomyces sp. DSM 41982]|uniref:Integral membrane protein n=1 Tax=Streptomyces evansiae TaxID=3075535 RepID=A0ABD5E4M9_9ACTN|nr:MULTISPECIES: hypothetical protein [unclassified Streptomyces]MDT0415633.1 hypothetical protein [Streptomyces sp. DSM 41982]SCD58581.1 hypothetical protein GA0115246_103462 [Streptomyces sp. SolWspMP-sol7th]